MKNLSQSQSLGGTEFVGESASILRGAALRDRRRAMGSAPSLLVKRVLDIGVSTLLIVATLPLLLLAAAAIALTDGGTPIFRQRRVGQNAEEFLIFKLRTMRPGKSPSVPGKKIFEKAKFDDRVTAVGKILRRFSIDELPQLFNVLLGSMSLVGPRPPLIRDMERFPKGRPMCRFNMRPGITGLWQVSGRSLLSDEERIRLDIEYVERWNLWLDIQVLLRTPAAVISGKGAF